ncbi:MAG TPA: SDR family NAD(P)-dependent oxidoreductase [Actinomycetospora sp.]|uniref:SDR family NAD(P)-dependent oxidoreductase n=1 Tax=Actinomycetospora sp. TaxID=1872135 RepID=UPI002F42CF06
MKTWFITGTSRGFGREWAVAALQRIGAYHASTWALEGFSQALAQEVAGFGIHVTLVEPGGFSTDWGGSSARHSTPLPACDGVREPAWQHVAHLAQG